MTLFLENVRLALFSLKANKMRALLTMLGIIIGIASVIAILTVGNSLKVYMGDEMSAMGSNNIFVCVFRKEAEKAVTEDGYVFEDERGKGLTAADAMPREMLENYCDTYKEYIRAISIHVWVGDGENIYFGKKDAYVYPLGTSLGYMVANNVKLLAGRFFNNKEFENKKKVCIVSNKVVDLLFDGNNEAAIGSSVECDGGDSFTIIGVYKYKEEIELMGMDFGVGDGDAITNFFIPLSTAQEMTHKDNVFSFYVVTQPGVDQNWFADITEQFCNDYYRRNETFRIKTFASQEYVEMVNNIVGATTAAIAAIASIALLVGGIGVMNIMLVSITERTREIGIRKSLGAPNSSIRLQFIVEAVVICAIGGIIGIILGIGGGSFLAQQLLKTPASPSLASIIGSLAFSMIIGIFFGFYPANKAAKMDPIEALRHE